MGTIVLQNTTVITTANMKLFLVAALLIASACAEPESEGEAKPWLAYGNYGYNYPAYGYSGYAGYAGHYGYAGYPYTHGYRHFWKRDTESEAEPEAKPDAWYSLYGHGLTYPYAHHSYVAGYPYAHASYAAPVTTVGRYVAPYYNTYGLGYLMPSASVKPNLTLRLNLTPVTTTMAMPMAILMPMDTMDTLFLMLVLMLVMVMAFGAMPVGGKAL